VLKLSILFVG